MSDDDEIPSMSIINEEYNFDARAAKRRRRESTEAAKSLIGECTFGYESLVDSFHNFN